MTTSKTKQFCQTPSTFELDNVKNETSLRDFLNFRGWQHQKRSNSARRPSKVESWVQSWRPRANAAPARKKWCQVMRSAGPVTQNHIRKSEDLILQNATALKKSLPWSPNISDEHIAPATRIYGSSSNVPRLPSFLEMLQNLHVLKFCSRLPRETTSECPKVLRTRQFFALLSVHFFILFRHLNFQKCSQDGVFCTFWLRNVLRHVNFQKCFDTEVFCTFWVRNVLRATTPCTCSTSQPPKVFRTWGVCTFWHRNVFRATTACTFWTLQLPSVPKVRCVCVHFGIFGFETDLKRASRHNGVQLFISHLARWLRTRRFSEPTFRPSGATNHWKNTVFRNFSTFSHTCIFFLLTLSLL